MGDDNRNETSDIRVCRTCCTAGNWLNGYSSFYYLAKTVVLTLAMILNITIIATICATRRLKTIPNAFIASLAVSDIVFSFNGLLHCAVVLIGLATNQWPSVPVCRALGTIITFLFFLSLSSCYCNLIIISMERWVYISRPFLYHRLKCPRLAATCLATAWSVSVLANLDVFMKDNNFPIFYSQTFKFGLLLPTTHFIWSAIICSIYTHISVITCRQVRAIKKASFAGVDAMSYEKVDPRLTFLKESWARLRMLVYVFGTFFLLLTPNICSNIYVVYYGNINMHVLGFIRLLLSAHSCTNFFVYAFRDKDFKLILRKLFHKCLFIHSQSKVYPATVVCGGAGLRAHQEKKIKSTLDSGPVNS